MDGAEFGRYRLLELLGRGGMGEVWRAHDTVIDRVVAVKVLPAHLADDETYLQRFRREAHAAARLNHPHIIPIHNSGEIDGRLFVEMRLVEGSDLQAVLTDGPLEPARAVNIIGQIAKALHAAHKTGLVHRDVKPSNILIDEDDFAYLIDFGIARGGEDTRLTGTDNVIGSWHYMSPERLRAGKVDTRADIYALACVLYECLTGGPPYPGDNFEQQITAHLTEPPPAPSASIPNLPVALDPVIATGMAKEPSQRYESAVALARAATDAVTDPIPRRREAVQPVPVAPPVGPPPSHSGGSPSAATLLGPTSVGALLTAAGIVGLGVSWIAVEELRGEFYELLVWPWPGSWAGPLATAMVGHAVLWGLLAAASFAAAVICRSVRHSATSLCVFGGLVSAVLAIFYAASYQLTVIGLPDLPHTVVALLWAVFAGVVLVLAGFARRRPALCFAMTLWGSAGLLLSVVMANGPTGRSPLLGMETAQWAYLLWSLTVLGTAVVVLVEARRLHADATT
ncbi:MAG: serine/threonine-protein kinase [Mycobacterium sp.]